MLLTKNTDLIKYYEYLEFIDLCRTNKYPHDTVLHKHHIIPRHMGGNNLSKNLVLLSVVDHAKAHILFSECFDEGSYESIANIRSALIIDKLSISDKKILDKFYESYNGENNPFYGKSHTKESIKLIREKSGNATRGLNYDSIYGEFSEDQKNIRSKSVILKWDSLTTEERENRANKVSSSLKISGKMKGSNNPASNPIIVDGIFYSSISEAIIKFGYSYYKKLYSNHNTIKLIKVK
jgi:hypothetical protein